MVRYYTKASMMGRRSGWLIYQSPLSDCHLSATNVTAGSIEQIISWESLFFEEKRNEKFNRPNATNGLVLVVYGIYYLLYVLEAIYVGWCSTSSIGMKNYIEGSNREVEIGILQA